MRLTAIRSAIVCVAMFAVAPAQAQKHVTRADVNGEWNGVLDLEGGSHKLSFIFALTDSAFAGKVYDGGASFGDMERGALSGDTVKFNIDKLAFTGVIAGDKMKIALIVYNGSTRNFTATKKPVEKKHDAPRVP